MQKSGLVSSLIVLSLAVATVRGEDSLTLQKRLIAEFPLTRPTADNTDIVIPGAILTLQKSDLMLGPTSVANVYTNVYKDGRIQPNSFAQTKKTLSNFGKIGSHFPGLGPPAAAGTVAAAATADSSSGAPPRKYVKGEKMWVTRIDVVNDGKQPAVIFGLFTDAVNNVRYKGSLRFVYPKDATAQQVDALIAEVFTAQVQEAGQEPALGNAPASALPAGSAPAPTMPAPAEPQPAAVPDIPPPPPPADQPPPRPPTISLGQTPEQVIAALGQPQKIVKLPQKETYYYTDLKVIFTAGKVSDIQ